MNITENEVKEAIASILGTGLVRIRGICGIKPDFANAEADHLHNLPHLLVSFSIPLLRYYVDVERPDYLRTVGQDAGKPYTEEWKIIDDFLKEH